MAQVNRNRAHVLDTDGHTPWEKLRVCRTFLLDRRQALKIARLHKEKFEATKDSMDEWERREAEILNSNQDELIQDCIDEIAFLEEFEKTLMELAEPQRIPGKTDREMYELNFPNEVKARTMLTIQCELLTQGTISKETAATLIKDSSLMNMAIENGFLLNGQGFTKEQLALARESIEKAKPELYRVLENMPIVKQLGNSKEDVKLID